MTPPLSLPEVHGHLLSLADIDKQVVALAPCCQVPDLLSVAGLIIVGDETQDGGVRAMASFVDLLGRYAGR